MRFQPYRKIPIWENKRRVDLLRDFRDLINRYDSEVLHDVAFGEDADTDESRQTRRMINEILDEMDHIITLSGLPATVTWVPAPAVGGYVQRVSVITNFFNLSQYEIPYQTALDFIDRATGIYTRDQTAAWVRTFNPLFWIGLALDYVSRAPFALARRAGLSTSKIEDSWFGRLAKFIVWLLGAATMLAGLLQTLGLLDRFFRSQG